MSNGGSGNKVLLFVGLGCGLLAIIGACVGSVVVGVIAYRQEQSSYAYSDPYADPYASPSTIDTTAPMVPAPVPAGYRAVTGAGYSFAVPSDWNDLPPDQTLVSIGSPTQIGGFFPNVNLVNEPFFGDLESYKSSSRLQLVVLGASIDAERAANVGPLGAVDLEVTAPTSVAIQRITTHGGKGWVMTCSGGPGTMGMVRAQCQQIFETLRLQ